MPHTKAGYICADQTVIFTFRLQRSGGPYIPVRRSLARFVRFTKHIGLTWVISVRSLLLATFCSIILNLGLH